MTTCVWLPPNAKLELSRPGMSDGDKAAWKARHGCHIPAKWMIRAEYKTEAEMDGKPLIITTKWSAPSCSAHLGPMCNTDGGVHIVYPIGMESPRPTQELIQEAVDVKRAEFKAEMDKRIGELKQKIAKLERIACCHCGREALSVGGQVVIANVEVGPSNPAEFLDSLAYAMQSYTDKRNAKPK